MTLEKPVHVLFIDNFDSFVFNLVDEFERRHCQVQVWRNDVAVDDALRLAAQLRQPRLVVLSPGPGTPATAGCCVELVRQAPVDLPIWGVCLGHQAIIEAAGGEVGLAGEVVHGKASSLLHHDQDLFQGIPSPVKVGRYHSLIGTEIPDQLRVTATTDAMAMAVSWKERPVWGVQFHPESILTPQGGLIIENVIRLASEAGRKPGGEQS
jgi:anthranilate synthase/aminodeoxychorismate synthase-like glutamine amidotransferase